MFYCIHLINNVSFCKSFRFIQRFIENSNDLAFDYDEYTPGKRVYSMTDFLSVIASDDILEIDGKDKMRILYAFWGKADKNRLDLLYDKIKTV